MPLAFRWQPLLLCFFLNLYGTCARAQESPVVSLTASYAEAPLREVVKDLEVRLGLTFSYLDSLVAGRKLTYEFVAADWAEVADRVFLRNGIEPRTIGEQYVVLAPLRPATLRGWDLCFRVTDDNHNPLPFVTAGVIGRGSGGATGEDGWFRQPLRASSADSVSLSFVGFATRRFSPADLLDCKEVSLSPSGVDLTAIEVVEYLTDGISSTPEGREIVIRPAALSALPGFADNEVYRAVQLLPGVDAADETAGSLRIRGGARDQTQVLWDGINVYAPGHYLGMVSFFEPALVEEVTVWRGQADASYGGRLSGVVQLTTDEGITERTEVGGGLSGTHANAYAKMPLADKKMDLMVAGRSSAAVLLNGPTYRSYQQQLFAGSGAESFVEPQDEPGAFRDSIARNRDFLFRELNGRWRWRAGTKTRITLSGFYQQDSFDLNLGVRLMDPFDPLTVFALDYQESYGLSNTGGRLRMDHELTKQRAVSAAITYADFRSVGSQGITGEFGQLFQRSSGLTDVNARINYQTTYPKGNELRIGGQFQRLTSDYRESGATFGLEPPPEPNGGQTLKGNSAIAYATFGLRGVGPLRADLGMRAHYYLPTNKVYSEPRLTVSYALKETILLKAGYGRNHQFFGEVLELGIGGAATPASLWVLADGNSLAVSTAGEFTFGALVRLRTWLVDVELYHKRSDNLPAFSLGDNENVAQDPFTTVSGRNLGMDLLLKKRTGKLRSWLIYSLTRSRIRFRELDRAYVSAQQDRPHQLKLVNAYSAARWQFSLGWQYRSGARFTPATLVTDTESGISEVFSGVYSSGRLPVYARLDATVAYAWGKKSTTRGLRGRVALAALNLLDRKNQLSRSYDTGFTEDGQTATLEVRDRLGLGFTPNFSVRLGWR